MSDNNAGHVGQSDNSCVVIPIGSLAHIDRISYSDEVYLFPVYTDNDLSYDLRAMRRSRRQLQSTEMSSYQAPPAPPRSTRGLPPRLGQRTLTPSEF
jgi:hypothetical protein